MKRTIITAGGLTRIISLREFAGKHVTRREVQTNSRGEFRFRAFSVDRNYRIEDNETELFGGPKILLIEIVRLLAKADIASLAMEEIFTFKHEKAIVTNIEEKIEDLAIESLMMFGEPKFLVRVSKRTYFAATPGDFVIMSNDLGSSFCCTNRTRVKLFTFLKLKPSL